MPQISHHLGFDVDALPEVIEDSDDSVWETWDDSVMEMDCQIQAMGERDFMGDEDHDPNANVRGNRDF